MAFYFATTPYPKADIVTVGVPFDRTSSYIPGSRFAPAQIRNAFENVESYSPYQKKDLTALEIYDAGDIVFPIATTKPSLKRIQQIAERHLRKKKRILAIGGEHTITISLIRAHQKYFPELKVVQFDAHADWRDEYLGEKICHATAMRRVSEIVGTERLFQVGIRSMAKEEAEKKDNIFQLSQQIDDVVRKLSDAPVYITLDIDILDISVMPAVATPEPGGFSFSELVSAITKLSRCKIVGADLVEYNPLAAPALAYAATAAVLIREMLILLGNKI
ncbi:MAG: agmatinase [candidate division WOR-3 bacterium]